MLYKAKTLKGCSLQNLDGEEISKVSQFYFDDWHWTVRYLVANTGGWLTGRQVLISPYALVAVNADRENIVTDLTKEQIVSSPSLHCDKPVSRQFEKAYHGFYGYPMYWNGPCSWGAYSYPMREQEEWKQPSRGEEEWDLHLRSTDQVSGYAIQAADGEIGHVEDFVIDEETWSIRYLVVATRNWWPGKKVLVSPQWIDRLSWNNSKVFISLTREAILQSPQYTEEALLTRDYEIELHDHYNLEGYWVDELVHT
ncbi:MAG: PRC-barrel domain-containing protein [Prosthecobacter sp.]|uniref:PRC-barrel domain-containing protein n=1 Tax=Prosthecobacter sp. TaxID=1965333 RepID=UPI0025E670E4|nr:PRC-barrel domain-containing protein [Prosthecobacter sp.]MCF7788382.1 PRC-barrel domain-containing protein [Prosthecobacter sp.]